MEPVFANARQTAVPEAGIVSRPEADPAQFSDAQLRRFRATIRRLREDSPFTPLDRALDGCDEAICAYQSGLLDDDELHRELFG